MTVRILIMCLLDQIKILFFSAVYIVDGIFHVSVEIDRMFPIHIVGACWTVHSQYGCWCHGWSHSRSRHGAVSIVSNVSLNKI